MCPVLYLAAEARLYREAISATSAGIMQMLFFPPSLFRAKPGWVVQPAPRPPRCVARGGPQAESSRQNRLGCQTSGRQLLIKCSLQSCSSLGSLRLRRANTCPTPPVLPGEAPVRFLGWSKPPSTTTGQSCAVAHGLFAELRSSRDQGQAVHETRNLWSGRR